jgi:nucleotide-binding universal stress UspA family protein
MRVLICTDGSSAAEQAATLVSRLNFPADTEIILLGVSETDGDQSAISNSLGRMEITLGGPRPGIQQKIRYGSALEQIHKETEENHYDLVAIGARGSTRGFASLRFGSTGHKLVRSLHIPILIARNVPDRINRLLICTAAEGPSEHTLLTGGALIANAGGETSLLHVMSQLAMRFDSPPDDLLDTANSAIDRQTREGRHLVRGMQILQEAGVPAPILPSLRHGLVVDEVLAEVEEGRYDLLVIGGHYQQSGKRWMDILLEDITGQLLSKVRCSVLIV